MRPGLLRSSHPQCSLLGAGRRMSSQTASGAPGERRVTVPLHDNLGFLHYKLTGDAVAGPSPGDLVRERTGPTSPLLCSSHWRQA